MSETAKDLVTEIVNKSASVNSMDDFKYYLVRGATVGACAFIVYKLMGFESTTRGNWLDIGIDIRDNDDKRNIAKIVDYRFDIGLKLSPQNTLDGITYNIEKDLQLLRQLYQREYCELYSRRSIKTVFFDKFKNGYIDKNSFKVMQFNMLADGLTGAYWPRGMEDNKSFTGVDKRCLEWKYRGLRIVEEIIRSKTDIACIQECDRSEFIDAYLSKYGFKYIFQEKYDSPSVTRVAPRVNTAREKARKIAYLRSKNIYDENDPKAIEASSDYKDNENDIEFVNDGCAIFYNTKKFKLIENDENKKIQIITRNDNSDELTAVAIPLKQLSNNKEFLLITTHLKSTKTAAGEQQRKQQIDLMFNKNNSNNKCYIENKANLPILMCLDMNANHTNTKDYDAMCYNSIINDYNFISLCKDGMTTKDELNRNMPRGKRGNEPEYTTFKTRSTGTVKHTIDYIFEQYNGNGNNNKDNTDENDENSLGINSNNNSDNNGVWSVTEYWEIPKTDKVIPGWFYPSDHFCLCLELTWNE